MAPGGVSKFCDDCGYQACFVKGECLQARGAAIGVDPQDLIYPCRVWLGLDGGISGQFVSIVRALSNDELRELEQELLATHPDRPPHQASRHE